MNLMQEILLYSDATYFDADINGKNLATGAGILRSTNRKSEHGFNKKYIISFFAETPVQAEIETGFLFLQYIYSKWENPVITWYCDLPYIENLLLKDDVQKSLLPIHEKVNFLKKACSNAALLIKTPETSNEKKYHYLCHRACRMTREILNEQTDRQKTPGETNSFLAAGLLKRNSRWKILDKE
jgi:hypothetical protein